MTRLLAELMFKHSGEELMFSETIANDEIRHPDGTDQRTVSLKVSTEEVRLHAIDIGRTPQRFGSDDEYEFWVEVKSADMAALLFVLLREKYAGKAKAVDEFREFCQNSGVPHEFGVWS